MSESIFEKIIKREIPAVIVYEDQEVISFWDVNPQAPVHLLVVPKRRINTLDDLSGSDTELVGKLVVVSTHVARLIGVSQDGYRLVINCKQNGGQSVPHIHIHLLGGRPMEWPPG